MATSIVMFVRSQISKSTEKASEIVSIVFSLGHYVGLRDIRSKNLHGTHSCVVIS